MLSQHICGLAAASLTKEYWERQSFHYHRFSSAGASKVTPADFEILAEISAPGDMHTLLFIGNLFEVPEVD
jgi:hypothetical protein